MKSTKIQKTKNNKPSEKARKQRQFLTKKGLKNTAWVTFIIVILGAAMYFMPADSKFFSIVDANEQESEFLINVINCTDIAPKGSDFLVPLAVQNTGRVYSKTINDTHGQLCWYDAHLAEDLNVTWLKANCEDKSAFIFYRFVCDEGFVATK